jgi:hypothetical protein
MINDQIFTFIDENGVTVFPIAIRLDIDRGIYLIQVFEVNEQTNKKYLRGRLIMVKNTILTSTFCDTTHFMEELNLFEQGNDQNKYLCVTEYKQTKNLKFKYKGEGDIFLSKSAARAICAIYKLAFIGYSTAVLLEKEITFTPQMLTQLLHKYQYLTKLQK